MLREKSFEEEFVELEDQEAVRIVGGAKREEQAKNVLRELKRDDNICLTEYNLCAGVWKLQEQQGIPEDIIR